MARQTSVQISEATDRQVKQLAEYGSFTDVVRIAIDRMWDADHMRKHFELAQTESGTCPWCGWDAAITSGGGADD